MLAIDFYKVFKSLRVLKHNRPSSFIHFGFWVQYDLGIFLKVLANVRFLLKHEAGILELLVIKSRHLQSWWKVRLRIFHRRDSISIGCEGWIDWSLSASSDSVFYLGATSASHAGTLLFFLNWTSVFISQRILRVVRWWRDRVKLKIVDMLDFGSQIFDCQVLVIWGQKFGAAK